VSQFFRGLGVNTLSVRSLFLFVSAGTELDLEEEMRHSPQSSGLDDNVWFEAFLPQRLSDLADPESANNMVRDAFHRELLREEEQPHKDEEHEQGEQSKVFEHRPAAPERRKAKKTAKTNSKEKKRASKK
jgi:hypothetical protein